MFMFSTCVLHMQFYFIFLFCFFIFIIIIRFSNAILVCVVYVYVLCLIPNTTIYCWCLILFFVTVYSSGSVFAIDSIRPKWYHWVCVCVCVSCMQHILLLLLFFLALYSWSKRCIVIIIDTTFNVCLCVTDSFSMGHLDICINNKK